MAAERVLIDTSAWIEFYRPDGKPKAARAVAEALSADVGATNGMIQTELLAFVSDKRAFQNVLQDLNALHWLNLTPDVFAAAAKLGFALRRKSLTIPSTDLIIAASAMDARATLFHLDAHFEAIAKHVALKSKRLA